MVGFDVRRRTPLTTRNRPTYPMRKAGTRPRSGRREPHSSHCSCTLCCGLVWQVIHTAQCVQVPLHNHSAGSNEFLATDTGLLMRRFPPSDVMRSLETTEPPAGSTAPFYFPGDAGDPDYFRRALTGCGLIGSSSEKARMRLSSRISLAIPSGMARILSVNRHGLECDLTADLPIVPGPASNNPARPCRSG